MITAVLYTLDSLLCVQNVYCAKHRLLTQILRLSCIFMLVHSQIEKHVITEESDRWAVLYCGTSEHVADTLKKACKTARVAFRWEYFGEW
jgi:hypothetical protein